MTNAPIRDSVEPSVLTPRPTGQAHCRSEKERHARRGGVAVVAGALVMLLAGCDRNGPEPGSGTQVSETTEDVDYYYACGNEVLELADGRRFYPFVDQDGVDEDAYGGAPTSQAVAVPLLAATLAVPAPQPGDDTGTLTVYEDGTAHFVSETGTEAWLTGEEQTYNWVC